MAGGGILVAISTSEAVSECLLPDQPGNLILGAPVSDDYSITLLPSCSFCSYCKKINHGKNMFTVQRPVECSSGPLVGFCSKCVV